MHELAWEDKFNELCHYLERREEDKGCQQQQQQQQPASLKAWIATQRAEKRYKQRAQQNHLTDEREEKLNRIGFEWNANELRAKNRNITWMRNFERLKQHMEKTGSSKVQLRSKLDDGFPIWVRDQRRYFRAFEDGIETPMTQERWEVLRGIGFE